MWPVALRVAERDGRVESSPRIFTPWNRPWIEVDGKRIEVSLDEHAELRPGDQVSVEYLPRSRVAVFASGKRGSVLGV